ncbi:hypothetical protein [Streptomyces sp. CRN 30]|uniref:hypothetical protein n=1 Tax=Streptomyces sp. CRN 30 TaxID=3075613 RepID=UPI002A8066EA|nr:hypothetical protein [Streptomyces sp. CRN 30]
MTEETPEAREASAAVVSPGGPPLPDAPPDVPSPAPPPKDRRVLRAVLRWTAVTVAFVAAGTASAYGITRMERTDVPGLATESDGRWDYPDLTRPALPEGRPGPFESSNPAGTHAVDLRELVLPAPRGAREDKTLRGTDGWLPTETLLAEYTTEYRDEVGQNLIDHGLRHIAARGWTTDDGTRTRIYLLHFDTAAVVDDLTAEDFAVLDSPGYPLRGSGESVPDEDFYEQIIETELAGAVYTEAEPYGAEQVRHGYLAAGDVLALVVQSRAGGTPAVPFRQTVSLQSELLT